MVYLREALMRNQVMYSASHGETTMVMLWGPPWTVGGGLMRITATLV